MEEVYINIKDMNECYFKKYLQKKFNKDLLSINELLGLAEELLDEIEEKQEKYDNLIQDLKDNYKPIPYEEQIGYNRNW